MVLNDLQTLLSALYDAPVAACIEDHWFTDRALLPDDIAASPTDEHVLVQAQGEEAGIGVFLDAALVARLEGRNPCERLTGENLADFCAALEGVSHFHYLAWNAQYDRGVSIWELELQAEVDKYIAAVQLLHQQTGRHPDPLHRQLFARSSIDPQLAGSRYALYGQTDRCAERFCRRLDRSLSRQGVSINPATLATLRRFYRASRVEKANLAK